jgi:hypothetical protein
MDFQTNELLTTVYIWSCDGEVSDDSCYELLP